MHTVSLIPNSRICEFQLRLSSLNEHVEKLMRYSRIWLGCWWELPYSYLDFIPSIVSIVRCVVDLSSGLLSSPNDITHPVPIRFAEAIIVSSLFYFCSWILTLNNFIIYVVCYTVLLQLEKIRIFHSDNFFIFLRRWVHPLSRLHRRLSDRRRLIHKRTYRGLNSG